MKPSVTFISSLRKHLSRPRTQKKRRAAAWFLCAWAAVGLHPAHSQTASVSGTIDAQSGGNEPSSLHGVKVVVRDPYTKKTIGQPLIVDAGKYTISSLRAGKYEIFACDSKLDYEPVIRAANLKEGSSPRRDIHLRDDAAIRVVPTDEKGNRPDPNVRQLCLVHKETGCKAIRENEKTILIPGPEGDFDLLPLGDEPCK